MNRRQIVIDATRAATRLRADAGVGPVDAICPYDLAERLGAVVRFVALPSLEGMYAADGKGSIIISTERPAGRRRYTCAHELGHRTFGHGTRCVELDGDPARNPEELLAECFAAALLMPKLCIESAFARRHWPIGEATAEQVFAISQSVGVGYATLVGHMERTLRLLSRTHAVNLARTALPAIRTRIAGRTIPHDLYVVDRHWGARPVDVEVGDMIRFPEDAAFHGVCASRTDSAGLLVATVPGTGTASIRDRDAPVQVRVARRAFAGLARFRHLEDVDDDD